MKIDFLFPQVVYSNYVDLNTDSIEKYSYRLMRDDNGRKVSNVGGWQSNDLFLSDFNNQNLNDTIHSNIRSLFSSLSLKLDFFVTNLWININGKNDYNIIHTHPGSFLSGILYIKAPKNSGSVVFYDPTIRVREGYNEYWHLKVGEDLPGDHIFAESWEYQPEKNLLFLFPSWLEHYVKRNESDEERISIAFNIGVKKNGT
jgi:uncharacterized protein (TIGR02466 family)